MRIGVYDSGVGGLTVLDALLAQNIEADYYYVGDTAYMPYGPKPVETIVERALAIIHWLVTQQHIDVLVIACNTVATLLPQIQADKRYAPLASLKRYEPITPVLQALKMATPAYQIVGLMATQNTVMANGYGRVLTQLGQPFRLVPMACDGLAPLIETGHGASDTCTALLERFLAPLLAHDPQAVILGCTHYPHIKPQIQAVLDALPSPALLIDPSEALAQALKQDLLKQAMTATTTQCQFYVTDQPQAFVATSAALAKSGSLPYVLRYWTPLTQVCTITP